MSLFWFECGQIQSVPSLAFVRTLRRIVFRLWLTIVLGMAGMGTAGISLAADIEIPTARTEVTDEGLVLSADLRFDLTPALEQAVERGVPLHFLMEFELRRPKWYLIDERVASATQTWRLSYYALTRQYRLSKGAFHLNFNTLNDALRMLKRVRNWQVLDRKALKNGEYQGQLRVELDTSLLPKPFQLSAWASSDWTLASDPLRWPVLISTPAPGPSPQAAQPAPPAPPAFTPAPAGGDAR